MNEARGKDPQSGCAQAGGVRCPTCGAAIPVRRRFFGLVARFPSNCAACGAKLGYDLAGGIHRLDEGRD